MFKISRRMLGLVAATCALALAPLTPTAAAPQAGPLTAGVSCYSLGIQYNRGAFACDAYVSGGTGSYSYNWSPVLNADIGQNGGDYVLGSCTLGRTARVNLVVTDSSGASVASVGRFYCSSDPS
ncbi:MAG TPA: hypothetical protein DEF47_19505 [Herpetosiphon sp.]|uniref:Ig-like domain-containing protein n=1 Tax=Herpetosiphon aurantiacus (strain ATCC 23779 / DSM 785 / 114-95) TaxID=316274 RepID=A9B2T2_HERA2|nr:hypothetical protein [Herpetosiphon sp.]ABX05533.1 hypothetical protein Haur_2895 [Herpetosiphon aurantiacus DSM 785]HBW52079.1 hypothetical protein [Herpetosiphon sp.]